jgi:hypothetical protein
MKRTNLVLDDTLLDEAQRLSGERTYSRTVERALSEFVRRAKARRILDLAGGPLNECGVDIRARGERKVSSASFERARPEGCVSG